MRLWDVNTEKLMHTLSGHTSMVYSVSFSPDGNTLASTSSTEIYLWDMNTGNHIHTLSGHTSMVYSVSFSPDGNTLASTSSTEIYLWGHEHPATTYTRSKDVRRV